MGAALRAEAAREERQWEADVAHGTAMEIRNGVDPTLARRSAIRNLNVDGDFYRDMTTKQPPSHLPAALVAGMARTTGGASISGPRVTLDAGAYIYAIAGWVFLFSLPQACQANTTPCATFVVRKPKNMKAPKLEGVLLADGIEAVRIWAVTHDPYPTVSNVPNARMPPDEIEEHLLGMVNKLKRDGDYYVIADTNKPDLETVGARVFRWKRPSSSDSDLSRALPPMDGGVGTISTLTSTFQATLQKSFDRLPEQTDRSVLHNMSLQVSAMAGGGKDAANDQGVNTKQLQIIFLRTKALVLHRSGYQVDVFGDVEKPLLLIAMARRIVAVWFPPPKLELQVMSEAGPQVTRDVQSAHTAAVQIFREEHTKIGEGIEVFAHAVWERARFAPPATAAKPSDAELMGHFTDELEKILDE
jgi:hypothetical protein